MIAVSRQGNLAVINHEKFQIHFNLAKGTWDYIDGTGQTIIKNGRTQVTLQDGSTVSTEDAGIREFVAEPMPLMSEPLSNGYAETRQYEVQFSHEVPEKGIRLTTYLHCFPDEPHIVLKVGIENRRRAPVALDSVTLLGIFTNRGADSSVGIRPGIIFSSTRRLHSPAAVSNDSMMGFNSTKARRVGRVIAACFTIQTVNGPSYSAS